MFILSLPFVLPIVEVMNWDRAWFGVFLMAATAMSQLCPPLGFSFYAMRRVTGETSAAIARATVPHFLVLARLGALIITRPEIVLSLPRSRSMSW